VERDKEHLMKIFKVVGRRGLDKLLESAD